MIKWKHVHSPLVDPTDCARPGGARPGAVRDATMRSGFPLFVYRSAFPLFVYRSEFPRLWLGHLLSSFLYLDYNRRDRLTLSSIFRAGEMLGTVFPRIRLGNRRHRLTPFLYLDWGRGCLVGFRTVGVRCPLSAWVRLLTCTYMAGKWNSAISFINMATV